MASKIDIMNKAINLIGEPYINSPTQATKAASIANQEYDQVRDAVLRAHPWKFATKRRKLAQHADTPIYQWAHAFPVPSDFIRIVSVSDIDIDYEDEEGPPWELHVHGASNKRCIMMDTDTCYIKYVFRHIDESAYDPLFIEAFAHKLSAEIAYAMTQDRQLYRDKLQTYTAVLKSGKSIDSQENGNAQVIDDEWISRRNYRGRG